MDETKKALLSIELDTAALTQNAEKAKETVKALAEQLKELKAAGKEAGEGFDKVVEQLKKVSEEAKKGQDDLKAFSKTIIQSTKESANAQAKLDTAMLKTMRTIADLDKQYKSGGPVALDAQIKSLVAEYTALTVAERENEAIGGQLENRIIKLKAQQQGLTVEQFNQTKSTKNGTDILERHRDIIDASAFSIGKSKTAIASLTREYLALSAEQRKNSEVGGKINEQIKILQANIEDLSGPTINQYKDKTIEAMQKTTNFGETIGKTASTFNTVKESIINYKDKVSEALAVSDSYNNSASNSAKAWEVIKTGTQIATGGFDGLGKAISGTGFGLLLTILAKVIEHFKNFTPLVELSDRVTAALNGTFDALGNVVGKLLSPLLKIFTEPKQAIKDMGSFLVDNILNRFKAIGVIGESVWHILKGVFTFNGDEAKKGFKGLTDGVVQLSTGVTNATDKITGFAKTIGNAAEQSYKLKGAQQELDRHIQASSIKNSEDAANIAKKRAEMQNADLNTRKRLQKEIDSIEAAQTKRHKDETDEQIRITTATVAAKHGLAQTELSNLTVESIEKLRISQHLTEQEVKSLQETIKQRADLNKKDAEDYVKKHKTKEEELKKHLGRMRSIREEQKKEKTKNGPTGETLENSSAKLNTEDTNTPATGPNSADSAFKAADKENKRRDDEELKNKKLTTKEKLKLIAQEHEAYKKHFDGIGNMFAKNTQASKAAFLAKRAIAAAEMAINIQTQVSDDISATKKKVKADWELGLPLGPILSAIDIAIGAAEVVGTITNGAKQIASINSANPSGFARGGLYLSDSYGGMVKGPGHGTSDSINARLSNGESVINARSTEMFAPILSAINQAGGGRAFNTSQGNGYALGGIFSGSNTLNDSSNDLANTRAMNDMIKTMAANMPRQVLVVEDVQASLQNKVMLQNMSNF